MESEPFKNPSPETGPSKEALNERYFKLLWDYEAKFEELKRIQRRYPAGITDPEVKSSMQIIDQERHQIHLRLVELGSKLGKSKADVLIEILRREGNLGEFGLPEFGIKRPEDMEWSEKREKIKNDGKILLIFDYTTADYGGELMYSEDHEERIKRAKLLAEEIGEEFISIDEGFSHESTETLGVVFPKEDLEKVAAIIRNNPKKFRLGKEFYE